MKKNDSFDFVLGKELSVGRIAMLLSLTQNKQEEQFVKEQISRLENIKFVVTGLGGMIDEIPEKIVQAVVGAALNSNVIDRTPHHIHALIHAAQEGARGMMLEPIVNVSYAMKVSIVSNGIWIAVALYGQAAFHPMTNHERSGMGVMHLGAL